MNERETQPPQRHDQEWANTVTHAAATMLSLGAAVFIVSEAYTRSAGLTVVCVAYAMSVVSTFGFSTLSHYVRQQPLLDTMRSWDQAMIYTMISGTYSPIAYRYLEGNMHQLVQSAIWIAAFAGVFAKLAMRHRINAVTTPSYLLLGWLPSLPMIGAVPRQLVYYMMAGGIVYTIGVIVLLNDRRHRYIHAVWHLLVLLAASIHFWGILNHVVRV